MQETLDHFRPAFEDAPIGVAVISASEDHPGRFLDVNPAFCAMTGYSRDQLLRQRYQDITHPDDVNIVRDLRAMADTGDFRSFQIEKRYLHADGHVVWVSLSASRVTGADGSLLGWLTFLLDETARVQTEAALVKREHQLAEAQHLARLGSWEWDIPENKIVWSDEFYRILGLRPQELEATYEGFMTRVHPDDRPRVNESVTQALERGAPYENEIRVQRPDASIRVVSARGRVVRDADGRPIRMVGTAHDITDAKAAEAALQGANARLGLLRAITAAANEASDLDEALQTAVDEICTYTGCPVGHAFLRAEGSPPALASKGIWHLDDPPTSAGFRRRTEEALVGVGQGLPGRVLGTGVATSISDVSTEDDFFRAREAGEMQVRSGFAFPVVAGGGVCAVLEFFRAETADADEDLLALMTEIGVHLGRVAERQQARKDLAQARDQALDASRAKSEFLATMSHEIRTPMNGVIGLTGLLLDTGLTDTQRHYAYGVRASGEALLGIINDILDFSKIEAGKLELETVDFDLARAIEEVAALVAESARAKDLELVAYCRPGVPTAVRGDVGRIRQILLNFATNAVKFTAAGEVVLQVGLAEEPRADGVTVRFEVADTGVGVDPAIAAHLFEPFTQADASTTRRFGGTGLGLAICRRLAEAMGGAVGVESQSGQGSTFWLSLPLAYASEPGIDPTSSGNRLAGRRVLVVDDNQTNRLVLASQLRAWDIAADVASDAEAALVLLGRAAAEPRPYELALLDMTMPGMDGLELAGRISADPRLASVRLLLLSSVSVEAAAAADAGFVARLTKPVRLSILYDALMRALTPSAVEAFGAVVPGPAVRPGSRGTLLIVEDHAVNQEVARGMVTRLGYGSDLAGDGLEALAALERRTYSAVLMDCHMPDMDGFQATVEIRRREAGRSHVPIIAMTAGATVEDREKCVAAGMDDYLAKPIKDHELAAKLSRWVVGGGGADIRAPEPARDAPVPDPDPDADGVLDPKQFDGLRQLAAASGDAAFLRDLVDQYLDQAGLKLAALREAARRGDASALERLAHGLRGMSATMGACGVASACAVVEECAARAAVAAPDTLDLVAHELERASTALRAQFRPR